MGAKAPRPAAGSALPSCKLRRMLRGLASSLAGVSRGDRVLLGVLLLYGVALWVLRPMTPFEQDEVLFLRGLEKYDVAKHAPHPPGYPLYIGIGKAVRALVGDPVTALQLVSVVAAMATLLFAWLLARRVGATRGEATAAAMIIATVPTWLFHAAVGFSDVPGTAVALAATWALLSALDRPTVLPLAGVAVAAAAAVRPQLLLVLFPLGVAALVVTARRGRWTALASAAGSAVGVSLACWLPAVLVTGPSRFRQALVDAGTWVATQETNWHLPEAPLAEVAHRWLVNPWGTLALAGAFWLLVVAGAIAFWRSDRGRIVVVAAGSAGFYALTALWTMNMTESVRYVLPALPLLAILAGGVAGGEAGSLRRVARAGVAVWCLAAFVWLWPALKIRSSQPAPVWECLSWVASHADPSVTTVVFDGTFRPHVGYLLSPRGFRVEEKRQEIAYANFLPSGSVLFVTRDPRASGEALLRRSWDVPALDPFSRHYYERCTVTLEPAANSVRFSDTFHVQRDWWELTEGGEVWLPEGAPMQLLRVVPGDRVLHVSAAGGTDLAVEPGTDAFVPLLPGPAGTVHLLVLGGGSTRFPGLELLPASRGDWEWLVGEPTSRELFVPAVAHAPGRMQTLWITDLLVRNPQAGAPLAVELRFSQTPELGGGVLTRRRTVPPGRAVLLKDLIATEFGTTGRGALRLRGSGSFSALWRTYDEKQPHTSADPALLRPLRAAQTVREGMFPLRFKAGTNGVRSNVGFFNPSAEPCEVRLVLSTPGSQEPVEVQTLRLPPASFDLRDADKLLGVPRSRTITAELTLRFLASRPVLAFASIIENDSNRSSYVFAGEPASPVQAASAR